MNPDDLPELTDTDRLALSALTEAYERLVSDIVDAGTYRGPDAHHHAQNQAQRELAGALVDLVRAKRVEPLDEPTVIPNYGLDPGMTGHVDGQ
jgi:hypothetical protein